MCSPGVHMVTVVNILNSYVAVHVNGAQMSFLSPETTSDLSVAQDIALFMADSKGVLYEPGPIDLAKPLLSVVEWEARWYPADVYSDRIAPIFTYDDVVYGADLKTTLLRGETLAAKTLKPFVASIGMSWCKKAKELAKTGYQHTVIPHSPGGSANS